MGCGGTITHEFGSADTSARKIPGVEYDLPCPGFGLLQTENAGGGRNQTFRRKILSEINQYGSSEFYQNDATSPRGDAARFGSESEMVDRAVCSKSNGTITEVIMETSEKSFII